MGEHSAKGTWTEKAGKALRWVRTHKTQVASLSVVAVGLASRYAPGFPAEDVLRIIGALLGIA